MSYKLPLKQWCAIKKVYGNKPYSHTFLDKGVVQIPSIYLNEFLKCYAWNIKHNMPVSVSELRSPFFRFFIDIDFELPIVLSKEQVINLVENIQITIKDVIEPIEQLYCIISQSEPKYIDDIKIKNGIHLIWPRLYVDEVRARKLRDIIVQKFSLDNSTHDWESVINETAQDWESVIDESVYVNSGLRMMYSSKAEKCSSCKGKISATKFCNLCINKGFHYNRPYKPIIVMDMDGCIDKKREKMFIKEDDKITENDIFKILHKTSIRSEKKESTLIFNEPLPSWYKSTKFIKGRVTRRKKTTNYLNDPSLIEETKMKCGQDDEHIDRFDERYIQIQDFIRNMWPVYSTINITAFIKKKRRKHYYYYMRTDQHYCHNIAREHGSNHIWLTIDPDTRSIMQRCFDNDCSTYMTTIDSLKLNNKIFALLYPELSSRIQQNKEKIIPKIGTSDNEINQTIEDIFNNDLFN